MGRGSGPGHRLTTEERDRIQVLVRTGHTHGAAAAAVSCSAKSVQRLFRRSGGLKPRSKPRSALRLTTAEREEISRGMEAGFSCHSIANLLGRSPSTVSRDVAASGGRRHCRALRAEARAVRQAHRPKQSKLRSCPALRREVERRLQQRWSPQQISARLRTDFPDDLHMRVSHETIYQSLFVQGRGALRSELTRCLLPRDNQGERGTSIKMRELPGARGVRA